MSDDKISDALGTAPVEGEIVENFPKAVVKPDDNTENDYKYARENFYLVIENGTKALEEMMDLARASEHPRAYEVISTLMKTLVDANKDLVAMNEKRQKDKSPQEEKNVTNNNLFVGSTSDLQQMLKDLRNDDTG